MPVRHAFPSFCLFLCLALPTLSGETLRIATYNVKNYNLEPRFIEGRREAAYPKPEKEKTALRQVIKKLDADVLALQEIGGAPFVAELQSDLARDGCAYPHSVTLPGPDEKRQLTILSRRPFAAVHRFPEIPVRYQKTNNLVSRGLLGVDIQTSRGPLTVYTLHLKSRLTDDKSDPSALAQRLAEATAIRQTIAVRQSAAKHNRFLLLGDCNDQPTSAVLRRLGQNDGKEFLRLLQPQDSRGEVWTYHNARDGYYSRSDYVLISPALQQHLGKQEVFDQPPVLDASDHRPVYLELKIAPPKNQSKRTPPVN